jgi:hypothetical protein
MNRTPEFVLSLIAVTLNTVIWLIHILTVLTDVSWGSSDLAYSLSYVIGYESFHIAMLIFLWIGTFKINKNSNGWGIFILIMGVLNTLSVYFFSGVLFLIAGIMMLARKPKVNKQ